MSSRAVSGHRSGSIILATFLILSIFPLFTSSIGPKSIIVQAEFFSVLGDGLLRQVRAVKARHLMAKVLLAVQRIGDGQIVKAVAHQGFGTRKEDLHGGFEAPGELDGFIGY